MQGPAWRIRLGFATFLALGSVPAQAADYHVATSGDDAAGDGSVGSPWRTLGHAINQGIPAEGGHNILVADGVYEGTTLVSRGFPNPVVIRGASPLERSSQT